MNKPYKTLEPTTRKFRLGLFAGDMTQPISLMRHLGPLAAMMKEDDRLELVFPQIVNGSYQIGWTWLCRCDAIFYSHPSTDLDISILWLANQMGIPVWGEYVDDLFNVEPTNPAYHNLKNKRQVRELVTKAMELCAFVTAVSKPCASAYPTPERIGVIPEACLWPANHFPRRKCISWRGMGSHDQDTAGVIEAVCRVAKDFPEWEWCILGEPNPEFVQRLEEAAGKDANGESLVKVAPFFSTPWHAITAWGYRAPYLHIVPLADTAFNRAKSHLAWLEATAIGAACVVPDYLPEWQQPGVIPYAGGQIAYAAKEDFETVLRRELLTFKEIADRPAAAGGVAGEFHPNVRMARAAVYPARTQAAINQLRWQVLRKLEGLKTNAECGMRNAESTPEALVEQLVSQRLDEAGQLKEFISRSQAGQDRLVYELLVRPERLFNGTFLDIGCHTPEKINNTFALEQLGWRGLLVDIEEYPGILARKSSFLQCDAALIEWPKTLTEFGLDGLVIDYVSLDVDEAQVDALKNLLAANVKFRVATIEHDGYRFGEERTNRLRAMMHQAGYTMVAKDVKIEGVAFEDWWVDTKLVKLEGVSQLIEGLEWTEAIKQLSAPPAEMMAAIQN